MSKLLQSYVLHIHERATLLQFFLLGLVLVRSALVQRDFVRASACFVMLSQPSLINLPISCELEWYALSIVFQDDLSLEGKYLKCDFLAWTLKFAAITFSSLVVSAVHLNDKDSHAAFHLDFFVLEPDHIIHNIQLAPRFCFYLFYGVLQKNLALSKLANFFEEELFEMCPK